MAKGVPHYFRDGTKHVGDMHKMPNGQLHSGKTHGPSSKRLYHLDELSKTAKEKAMKGKKTPPKKKKPAKKAKPMQSNRGKY